MTSTLNPLPFRASLLRRVRPRAAESVACQIHALLRVLGEVHPVCKRWFALDRGFKVDRCSRLEDIVAQIASAEIEWDEGMRSRTAPSHRARFFNGVDDGRMLDMSIVFALEGDPLGPYWGLRVDLSLGAAFGHGSPGVGALQAIFLPCVRIIEPDCAFLGTAQVPARVGQGITAGWLTYVAGASLPGRSLGPPAEIQRLDGLGHMIVAQPEPFQEGVREHVEAVRAVQRALDGEENAAEPSVILVDNDPESRWARWAGVHSTVETGRVDLALMRRIVLPFKEGAAPSPCASAALVTRANDEAQCPFPNGDETMLLLVLAPPEGIPSAQTGALSLANGEAAASALTLEQYAALCAELTVFPAQVVLIYQRYGILSAGARGAVDDEFGRRFLADPGMQQRWQALVLHYARWHRRPNPR